VPTLLLSGASGFIGSSLAAAFAADGYRVVPLVRLRPSSEHSVAWDPSAGVVNLEALEHARPDVVINLAGEPIDRRWTARRRAAIRSSRVRGTAALADALARLEHKPSVLVSGSAVGYYGAHRGAEPLDESSPAGSDFLAETAREWENATAAAARAGIRVVNIRTGVVLGRSGGMLRRLLLPFRLGLGARMGRGDQWMAWIALTDVVRGVQFLVERQTISGAVNLAAPNPVQNTDFTKTLGRVLHRPALLTIPTFALELVFGTMADNTILASQRAMPRRLSSAGFEFRYPDLESALRNELTRSAGPVDR
jgi:hypothetical protein